MSAGLTIGGEVPSGNPEETYGQELGDVVVSLSSAEPKKRRTAYIRFYEIRRKFTKIVWDDFIQRLDGFRAKHKGAANSRSIMDLIAEISKELISLNPNQKEPSMAKSNKTTHSPVKTFTSSIVAVCVALLEAAKAADELFGDSTGVLDFKRLVPDEPIAEKVPSTNVETKEEPPKEEPKAADPAALRKECTQLIPKAGKALGGVKGLTELFAKFGVKGIPAAPDAMLPEIKKALEDAINK